MMDCGLVGEADRYHAHPHWQTQLHRRAAAVAMGLVLCVGADVGAAAELHDTVVARAREAWEADDGEAMFFAGDLELHGSKWRITADTARVEGRLEDPDLVVVDGSPARIVVGRSNEEEPFEGRSQHLEFEPRKDVVRLEGEAMIVKGQQSISSETIKYLLDRDTFAAGSHGRVRVVTQPNDK